ncbi:beta-agarase [Aquimarina agarivorans]|uniref:beta-agarase n=1 Tax=Aquimarina agarivorans TaxID=980584 RepID=UPI000248FDB1|nr:beta-agarase [Aquimarina agarivorans]
MNKKVLSIFGCLSLLTSCVLAQVNKSKGKDIGKTYETTRSGAASPITGAYKNGNCVLPNSVGNPPVTLDWEVVPTHSDEFNYSGKGAQFKKKWKDTYFNAWTGPGLTYWEAKNTNVKNGNLKVMASRKSGTNKVNCGVITSKKQIKYPIYSEVRAKVANHVLSSNFWFLSPDDKREIDVLEIYGSDRDDHRWFAARPSTNYHVFVREEEGNAIIEDLNKQHHHTLPNEKPWREDWHRFGAYWKDPFTIDFYYDGKIVHELRKEGINDPEGLGMDRDSYMIIDLEDHDWRSNAGNVATDRELADSSRDYLVDYVRTYRPIAAQEDSGLLKNGSFNDPTLTNWYWTKGATISANIEENEGDVYALKLENEATVIQKISVTPSKTYELSWKIGGENGAGVMVEIYNYPIGKKVVSNGEMTYSKLKFHSGKKEFIYVIVKGINNSGVIVDDFELIEK